jgi:NRAMP (natural resistance-associated macrophage protein)-like metal ion transporter
MTSTRDPENMTDAATRIDHSAWRRFLFVAGPGIVVMLADTDAGSLITAAQSGAQWGYRLLLPQLILIPVLFLVQELTVRLGAVTGKGHAQLIKEQFGGFWAWVSVVTLVLSCIGALLTEFSGLAGVGALIGVPVPLTLALTVTLLLAMAVSHTYMTIERIAIGVGAFELVFLLVAWRAHPQAADVASAAFDMPLADSKYLFLLSANIGAVVMPWMVFFQQASVVERGLSAADLSAARLDTGIGAVVTQLVMAAALVATAATLGKHGGDRALGTVEEIAKAITPFLGEIGGKALFGLGMAGAALVATIVVTLTAARAVAEALGRPNSLDHSPREAKWFYGAYAFTLILGAIIVVSEVNLVALSVAVQVMNALLLPIVVGFLFLLARRLPEPYRLKGVYGLLATAVTTIVVIFGVYSGIAGLWS